MYFMKKGNVNLNSFLTGKIMKSVPSFSQLLHRATPNVVHNIYYTRFLLNNTGASQQIAHCCIDKMEEPNQPSNKRLNTKLRTYSHIIEKSMRLNDIDDALQTTFNLFKATCTNSAFLTVVNQDSDHTKYTEKYNNIEIL